MTAVTSYAEASLQPFHDLLVSDRVNEVVVNPDGASWVEYADAAHMQRHDEGIDPHHVTTLGSHLASETGNRLGEKHPIVSGRIHVFGQSMRVQIVVPPAVEDGVSVSIRKYISRVLDIGEVQFLSGRQVDLENDRRALQNNLASLAEAGELAELFRLAIGHRLNILVSGGTSSGKTTFARALLALTAREERLVTIEDAPELHPPHPNQVALVAERVVGSERSPARLLESALRMRPDRLILGEVRGEEALNFLEAINTGHPGSISTIHADSPALALERLALMVMRTGIRQTRQDVLDYARQTIDMVVQVGRRDGRRGLLQIEMPMINGSG